jgi:hypothetical protein
MPTNFRNLQNRDGVIYDVNKKKVFYAEDYNAHSTVINVLETNLERSPKLFEKFIEITPEQLSELYDNPITLIEPLETGSIIEVVSAFAYLFFTLLPYISTNPIFINYEGYDSMPLFTCGDILRSNGDDLRRFTEIPATGCQMFPNTKVILTTTKENPNAGNSPLHIYLIYRQIDIT